MNKDLRVLQINLNKSAQATESALQIAVKLNIDILLVQEPWLVSSTGASTGITDYSSVRSINHQGFVQIFPSFPTHLRPRTLTYALHSSSVLVSLASTTPNDPDVQVLTVQEKQGQQEIQLINLYNYKDQSQQSDAETLIRWLYDFTVLPNTIFAGDFNSHHPRWDPLNQTSPNAEGLATWIEHNNLTLLNTPGERTFYRPNLKRPSIIDLTLATTSLADQIDDWQVLPDLGSDHYPLLFTISGAQSPTPEESPQNLRFNTNLADWDLFQSQLVRLTANTAPSPTTADALEQALID